MLDRNGPLLVVMDVDSTVIEQEVIELIAAFAGVADEVRAVTESAMRGELDFEQSLRARVSLLAGLPVTVLDDVKQQVVLTKGARELCNALTARGDSIALVSGGFDVVVADIAVKLGIRHFRANTLDAVDGLLTGRLTGPIVDRAGKAAALKEFADELGVPMSRTVAVGDGANDLDMMRVAALGIAFDAKPVVQAQADVAINERDLFLVLEQINQQ